MAAPGAILIRSASLDDCSALANLSTQLGYASSVQETEERITPILEADDHTILVAALPDAGLAGFIHVFLARRVESDTFAEIGGLVVKKGVRGRGIGRLLMTAAETWARSQGVHKLRVRTRSTRPEAHTFYERLGFTQTKKQFVYDLDLG